MTLLIIYLLIAIGISFLCSILEAVLLSITPSYVEQVSSSKPLSGKILSKVKDKLDESLSSILILNTFAHTMGAAGVGTQGVKVFGTQWETFIAVLLTLAILYFSEIIPKTLGATFWRTLAVPSAFVILWLVKLVFPLVWLATSITRVFNRNIDNEITREEIIALASLSHRDGTLFTQENDYLANLLTLREIKTVDIYTPRTVVHILKDTLTVKEALDLPSTTQFSRIPVIGENIDDIKGKILRNSLYEAERSGHADAPITDFVIPIKRVSEKLAVTKLLDLFLKNRMHLFIVEDEYGQTSGIVSLEDAIETLIGREIIDESDTVTDMQALAKGKYRERLRAQKNKLHE
ncbi:CNNM domain-containing protein [Marinicellulosiphila megalodicopiae]|uniref:CNNM domain-containing protein n=1 Tax=Marinicellulosiphila megalodicopiae TaxID=2724896 RepID=UPI003BB17463